MFDSILTGGSVPKSRLGVGAIVSIVVHAALLTGVIFLSTRPQEARKDDPEVRFFAGVPAAAPAAPAPAAASKPKAARTEKKPIKKPDQIIPPREIPAEKPPEAEPVAAPEPEEEAPQDGAVEDGDPNGVANGSADGKAGGLGNGNGNGNGTQTGAGLGGIAPDVLPFGEGMSRPIADPSNRPPQYTREALEARIEGVMLVKCTITTEGELQNCRVIKPLPHMERAVLAALSKWKFSPVTFQGRAVSVDYVMQVRLMMPR